CCSFSELSSLGWYRAAILENKRLRYQFIDIRSSMAIAAKFTKYQLNFKYLKLILELKSHIHPAVHMNHLTGNVRPQRRSQECNRRRNVFRLAQALQRNVRDELFTLGFVQLARHVGVDETRRHGIHGNAA